MRLNKFLATAGIASRRKCDEIIQDGKVSVNGFVVKELGITINEKKDKVVYDGKDVQVPKSFVYVKMNKPKGYICSAKDEKDRKIIFDLIKEKDVRLFSIGRLDYDSEGLIILTNDGDFAERVMHPSGEIEKTYIVTVEGKIVESEMAVMRSGVVLDDGSRLPSCKVSMKEYKNSVSKLEVVIDEGKNRQIRRMFEQIGRTIIMLKRVQIGKVKLGGLSRGEYRDLTNEEITSLFKGEN